MKKYLIFTLTLAALGIVGYFSGIHGTSVQAAENTRILEVYVDGDQQTIATTAPTVEKALEASGVTLYEHDKTEPSADSPITATNFKVNVYRARPITVVDGANMYTITTAERTPRSIAQDAGFAPRAEDGFEYGRSDDPFGGTPGTRLYIKRSKKITFELYGTSSKLRTQALTVRDLIDEKGIVLEEGDEVNLPLATRIRDGMKVSIATIDKKVKTVEEDIPFKEERIYDSQQPSGYRRVEKKGANGRKLVTYEVTLKNGKESKKKSLKVVVTKKPRKQVVVLGAKESANVSGNCGEWLSQAGISNSDANWLIGKESGCNPGAVNVSSGACGIPQALPCSKLPCPLNATGAVCQLKWMDNYVKSRYGSWAGARAAHARQGWY